MADGTNDTKEVDVVDRKGDSKVMYVVLLFEEMQSKFNLVFDKVTGDLTEDRYEVLLAENRRLGETIEEQDSEPRRLIQELSSKLDLGINCIRRVVHIGVPYSMEEYCQEVGQAGKMALQQEQTFTTTLMTSLS
ncbi:hypothetical protein ACROYT_G014849 [Oculina patagonica]